MTRTHVYLLSLIFTAAVSLVACGSDVPFDNAVGGTGNNDDTGDGTNPPPVVSNEISVGLKDAAGNQLINLAGPWTTWNGEPTGITFDGQDLVEVPGSTTADLVLGVQRVDSPLIEGANYTLSIGASRGAVILFPFSERGELVSLPDVSGLALARSGQDLNFTAPGGISGFYVQVQNDWQATLAASIRPSLDTNNVLGGENFVNQQLAWSNWLGNADSGVGFNDRTGFVGIVAPEPGQPIRIGVQRYSQPLPVGDYLLSLSSQNSGSSLVLFMFDSAGQLISDGQTAWIAAVANQPTGADPTQNATGSVQFTVPEGVASFAIQVQGPWGRNQFTSVSELLLSRVTDQSGPFASVIPNSLSETNVQCRQVSIADDQIAADTGVIAKTYFVDNGRFIAGLDDSDQSLEYLHEVWGSDRLYCINPSRNFIDQSPPTGGPPSLTAATRTDLDDGSVQFTLPPARGTLTLQWRRIALGNGDIEYRWDSTGYTFGGVEYKRLTVSATGEFKACSTRFDSTVAGVSQTNIKFCGDGVAGLGQ